MCEGRGITTPWTNFELDRNDLCVVRFMIFVSFFFLFYNDTTGKAFSKNLLIINITRLRRMYVTIFGEKIIHFV